MSRPVAILLAGLLSAAGCERPTVPTTAPTGPRANTKSRDDDGWKRRGDLMTSEQPTRDDRDLSLDRVLIAEPDAPVAEPLLLRNVAPPPRRKFEAAPPPRAAGERLDPDLTNEDIGLDPAIPAARVERVEDVVVPGPPAFPDPIGVPDLPARLKPPGGLEPFPGRVGAQPAAASAYPGRSGATKAKLLKEYGGNEASEKAVALGLAYLARQQKQDGSWVYDAGSKDEVVAATGMAVLAFLGAGETHDGKGKYAKTVKAGADALVKLLNQNGAKAGKFEKAVTMYAQAIGALALCEAYGMTKDKDLLAPAQAAIDYIQKAQAANGSWGYTTGQPGDTSIVGWQVQALNAARQSKDIKVDDRVIKKAVAFLDLAASGSRKAAYGYNDNAGAAPGTALTAIGLLCRYQIDGWGPDNGGLTEGVLGLMKRAPVAKQTMPDLYFYYYATRVLFGFAGDEWREWNEGKKQADGARKGGMRDWLVGLQVTKDGANEGSWEPEGGWIGRSCGRVGTTAMSVLILETYYRHLPLYKRKNAGDGAIKIIEDK